MYRDAHPRRCNPNLTTNTEEPETQTYAVESSEMHVPKHAISYICKHLARM
jgi:hypothetical protein